jgi:hypothetical protein
LDILYLVDRLENLIGSSRKMPLVNQIMVKESELLNIVDQMRTSIPDEIKLARRVIQEKERIIAQAQADASTLLARAREESERAIKREGLLQAAGERSLEMVREAEENAEKLKNDADAYVVETLRALRDHLTNIDVTISRTILSIEKGLESLEPLADKEESVEGIFTRAEASSPMDGGKLPGRRQAPPPFPTSTPAPTEVEEGQPQTYPIPRRTSLAADTMGGPGVGTLSGAYGARFNFFASAGESGTDGQFEHTHPPDGYPQGSPPPPLEDPKSRMEASSRPYSERDEPE